MKCTCKLRSLVADLLTAEDELLYRILETEALSGLICISLLHLLTEALQVFSQR